MTLVEYLVQYGTPTAGGVAIFGTIAVLFSAVVEAFLDREMSYGDVAAYGGAVGGFFGFCVKLFADLGVQ